eukprot:3920705-Rhodomonas_salina.1
MSGTDIAYGGLASVRCMQNLVLTKRLVLQVILVRWNPVADSVSICPTVLQHRNSQMLRTDTVCIMARHAMPGAGAACFTLGLCACPVLR